jgi:hypothetical protein
MREAVDTTRTVIFRASPWRFALVQVVLLVGGTIAAVLVPVMARLATVSPFWPITFTVLALYLLSNALMNFVRYMELRRLGDVLRMDPVGFCDRRIADVHVPWREVIAVAYSGPVLYFDLASAERFPPDVSKKLIGRSPYGKRPRIELKSNSLLNASDGKLLHYATAYVLAGGGKTQRMKS